MDEDTRARFEDAVERKSEQARERSQQGDPADGAPPDADEGYEADVNSPRERSSRHRQVTADKWNQ
jgi:hypothetical protein